MNSPFVAPPAVLQALERIPRFKFSKGGDPQAALNLLFSDPTRNDLTPVLIKFAFQQYLRWDAIKLKKSCIESILNNVRAEAEKVGTREAAKIRTMFLRSGITNEKVLDTMHSVTNIPIGGAICIVPGNCDYCSIVVALALLMPGVQTRSVMSALGGSWTHKRVLSGSSAFGKGCCSRGHYKYTGNILAPSYKFIGYGHPPVEEPSDEEDFADDNDVMDHEDETQTPESSAPEDQSDDDSIQEAPVNPITKKKTPPKKISVAPANKDTKSGFTVTEITKMDVESVKKNLFPETKNPHTSRPILKAKFKNNKKFDADKPKDTFIVVPTKSRTSNKLRPKFVVLDKHLVDEEAFM
jgi:hypothetical protein